MSDLKLTPEEEVIVAEFRAALQEIREREMAALRLALARQTLDFCREMRDELKSISRLLKEGA
jgi:hypothetical protein